MDYEQKYKIALERAKNFKETCNSAGIISWCEYIFPELKESKVEKPNGGIVSENFNEGDGFYKVNLAYLSKEQVEEIENLVKKWNPEIKESEDEKIRKQIISFLKEFECDHYRSLDFSSWIAWLEKQEEQRTNDTGFKAKDCYVSKVDGKIHIVGKFEPKFKVGDWVVTDLFNIVQIKAIGNGKYILEDTMRFSIDVEYADYWWHKWTINDAKDGDVLVSANNQPFIYNGKYTDSIIGAHIGISYDGKELFIAEGYNWTANKDVKPATKEQRDFLFQRIKEDGYEWNADEKVVNKVIIYE